MPRVPDWLKQPFAEALEHQKEKVALPADTVSGLEAEYHDFAFVVSGLTRADLVSDMKWLTEKAIEEGMSFEDFQRQFDRLIGRKGWQPGNTEKAKSTRLYTILDTNVRRSHAAGRIRQARDPELLNRRPYWMWKWRDSVQPRPNHQALDGKVFLASDRFWDIATPPCAFGCRCSFFALSERDLRRMGKTVEQPPDPNTIAEPGFRRAPGTAPVEERQEILSKGLARQSPEVRQAAEEELRGQDIG